MNLSSTTSLLCFYLIWSYSFIFGICIVFFFYAAINASLTTITILSFSENGSSLISLEPDNTIHRADPVSWALISWRAGIGSFRHCLPVPLTVGAHCALAGLNSIPLPIINLFPVNPDLRRTGWRHKCTRWWDVMGAGKAFPSLLKLMPLCPAHRDEFSGLGCFCPS